MKLRQTDGAQQQRLFKLIDRALETLSLDRDRIGLRTRSEARHTYLELNGMQLVFGLDARARILAWEKLLDALPSAAERIRLKAMHSAVGEEWGAPWSVYSTATTIAWLARKSDLRQLSQNLEHQLMIMSAADQDGDVALYAQFENVRSRLFARLRARQMLTQIQLGENVKYNSVQRTFAARDVVPQVYADARVGETLADVLDLPWMRSANVFIDGATSDLSGTIFTLSEPLLPLAPIPTAAQKAAPAEGLEHGPWIVRASERNALDAIDAEAHTGI
jgi:hypothetical protein